MFYSYEKKNHLLWSILELWRVKLVIYKGYFISPFLNNSIYYSYRHVSDVFCYHCNLTLPSSTEALILHSKICSAVNRPDSKYRHVCYMCDYNSYYSTQMKRHIRQHRGEKPFICSHCSYSSPDSSNLKRHILIQHPNKENIWFFLILKK